MPNPKADSLILSRVADFLCGQIQQITDRWVASVHEDPQCQTANKLPGPELTDHVPKVLDDFADMLRTPPDPEIPSRLTSHAMEHGKHRLRQRYRLDELLRELTHLRGVIGELLIDFARAHPEFNDELREVAVARVHRLFDEMLIRSTEEFVEGAQADLRRHSEELDRVNAQLKQAHEQLQKADKYRLLLTRSLAHDLLNIVGSAGVATVGLREETAPEERDALLNMIERNVFHVSELVGQLLSYSILIENEEPLICNDFEPCSLCQEIVSTFSPQAEAKGLEFKSTCDSKLGLITSDELKIKRIVNNLVSNAIKYTQSGWIRVSFTDLAQERWEIVVEDSGPGITCEPNKIFEEFYRESTLSEPGTGLGLAITKRLVQLLGGEITVFSKPGHGSQFRVSLPKISIPPSEP